MKKSIKVGFSKPKSKFAFIAKLIMFIEKTEYSHIYIEFGKLVIQANHLGVTITSKESFAETNETVKEVPLKLPLKRYTNFINIVAPYLGKKYGIFQLIGVVMTYIFGIKNNPFKSGYICSELIYLILKDIYGISIDKDENLITPIDVYNLLISQDMANGSSK